MADKANFVSQWAVTNKKNVRQNTMFNKILISAKYFKMADKKFFVYVFSLTLNFLRFSLCL